MGHGREHAERLLAFAGMAFLPLFQAARILVSRGIPPDYASFLNAGRAALGGADPYGLAVARLGDGPNLNPPVSVPIFAALARLDPTVSLPIWRVASAALLAICVALLVRHDGFRVSPSRLAWLAAFGPFWYVIFQGQVEAVLLPCVVGAWLLIPRGRVVEGGALLGLLCAVKPQFGVWPLLLLLSGSWAPAIAAVLAFLAAWALPAFAYCPGIYLAWARIQAAYATPARLGWPVNASALGAAERIGVPPLGYLLAAFCLAVVAAWAWRYRPDPRSVARVALIAAIVCSPISWLSYFTLALPLFGGTWDRWTRIAALLLLVPDLLIWQIPPLTWLAPLATVCLVASLREGEAAAARSPRSPAASPRSTPAPASAG
jgi:hypothetical protein